MAFISLDRRFYAWSKSSGDPDLFRYMDSSRGAISWGELKSRRRVILLAEAGSGKTEEMTAQHQAGIDQGHYSFYTTVQKAADKGLSAALGKRQLSSVEEWQSSDRPAWFFFDSIDEAKAKDINLEDLLVEIANAIVGCEARAHVIISGRHSNWEFERDLERVIKHLPIPADPEELIPVDENQALISVLRPKDTKKEPKSIETPVVVVMAPLDKNRVAEFAAQKGISNVDAFLKGLNQSHLWQFARRPLDLGWLVDHWNANGMFGSLAEMLELSLHSRLEETNPILNRKDALSIDKALRGLERVGAALTLSKIDSILIPDEGREFGGVKEALKLSDALTDWSSSEHTLFINRPVFDPARAGLVRLHNDNEGVVRSYLTAKWIKRLSEANCPLRAVLDLLVANQYGVEIVRPTMRETAAWIALWDRKISCELIRIDASVLIGHGDPSSLPVDERKAILQKVIAKISTEPFYDSPAFTSLQRFAKQDMAPFIRQAWRRNKQSPAVRELLLLMIELGELTECADIAVEAAYLQFDDDATFLYASRALIATANSTEKTRFGKFVADNAETIASRVVWNAMESLFPGHMLTIDLIKALSKVDLENTGGLGLDHYGPGFIAKIETANEVEQVLNELLRLLGAIEPFDYDHLQREKQQSILSSITAAGTRLLSLINQDDLPLSVVTAAIAVGMAEGTDRRAQLDELERLPKALGKTPARRRASVWIAYPLLTGSKALQGQPLTNHWQLRFGGLYLEFGPEDLTWVLEDAMYRENADEQHLALSIAMGIWRDAEKSKAILKEITSATKSSPELTEVVREWIAPHRPSAEEVNFERQRKQRARKTALQLASADKSWMKFAENIRSNPKQLQNLHKPGVKGIDWRIFHIWKLLRQIGGGYSQNSAMHLQQLTKIFGNDALEEIRLAFMGYWRLCSSLPRSKRSAEERNIVYTQDSVALVGVTLEADEPNWASKLSHEDALTAAILATLEVGDLPTWLSALSEAKPNAVREVLMGEIVEVLRDRGSLEHSHFLQTLSNADEKVLSVVSSEIFKIISLEPDLPSAALDSIIRILVRGYKNTNQLLEFAISRFRKTTEPDIRAMYLGMSYSLDADRATKELVNTLCELEEADQTRLAIAVLPKIFGNGWSRMNLPIATLSVKNLERLIELAYKAIKVEEDVHRPSGVVYSPNERDYAENARWAAFMSLVNQPGFATIDALHRLTSLHWFPIPRHRMIDYAMKRAGQDSESAPWIAADVHKYENDFLKLPRTSKDLQEIIERHLSDIEHDLLNGSTSQYKTVARLEKEVAVQNWMMEALNRKHVRGYSIEREAHVLDEKEPDLQVTAKATDAKLPIEIKVAETWTLTQLEEALTGQLMEQYVRERLNRWGVLLLVHQKKKKRGWIKGGKYISFDTVVKHLKQMALDISGRDFDSPQLHIAVIDVTK